MSVYNTSTFGMVKVIATGTTPTWVAASSTRAYITNEYAFSMTVVDTVNNVVADTVDLVGAYPVAVALGK